MGNEVDMPPTSRNCEEDDDDFLNDQEDEFDIEAPRKYTFVSKDASEAPDAKWRQSVDVLLVGCYGSGGSFLQAHFGQLPVAATLQMHGPAGNISTNFAPRIEIAELPVPNPKQTRR